MDTTPKATAESVARACDAIVNETGKRPTQDTVRLRVSGGSATTITKYMDLWFETWWAKILARLAGEEPPTVARPEGADAVERLVIQVMDEARKLAKVEAEREFVQFRDDLQDQIARAGHARIEAEQARDATMRRMEGLQQAQETSKQERQALMEKVARLELEKGILTGERNAAVANMEAAASRERSAEAARLKVADALNAAVDVHEKDRKTWMLKVKDLQEDAARAAKEVSAREAEAAKKLQKAEGQATDLRQKLELAAVREKGLEDKITAGQADLERERSELIEVRRATVERERSAEVALSALNAALNSVRTELDALRKSHQGMKSTGRK